LKILILFCLSATAAFCQLFSVGAKVGVPLGNAYPSVTTNFSKASDYLVGGTVELHLPLRFSVELDAIYKRTGVDGPSYTAPSFDLNSTEQVRANVWEFPLLAKYEITGGLLRPFVDVGPVLRNVSGIKSIVNYDLDTSPATSVTTTRNNTTLLRNRDTAGFAIGGGIALKLAHFRVSPEIRYTRWTATSLYGSAGNQADFIVGFTF
jgi:hypothetical protein